MSEYRTPEEDTVGGRRDAEEAREGPGLGPEGGEKPEGAPPGREEHPSER